MSDSELAFSEPTQISEVLTVRKFRIGGIKTHGKAEIASLLYGELELISEYAIVFLDNLQRFNMIEYILSVNLFVDNKLNAYGSAETPVCPQRP